MTPLRLADEQTAADLATYLARAKRLDDEGDVAAHGVGEAEDVGGRGVRLGAAAFHDSRSCQTSLPGHSSPRGLGCVVTRLADERIALHRAPRTPSTALHRVPPHRSTCALDEVPWP